MLVIDEIASRDAQVFGILMNVADKSRWRIGAF